MAGGSFRPTVLRRETDGNSPVPVSWDIVTTMGTPISEATVLGAGVMGSAIAAHLANAGVRVRLLDLPGDPAKGQARNHAAQAGLEAARKAKPAAFLSPRFDVNVTVGNFEDHLAEAAKGDVEIGRAHV